MEHTQNLIKFINDSTDAYHTVYTITQKLKSQGFIELCECEKWDIKSGGKYYVVRNQSSIIAFKMPEKEFDGFMICASHTDSPNFKLKPNFECEARGAIKLSIEGYGSMIMSTWLDRPLSVSGRVAVQEGGKVKTHLVKIGRDLFVIPSLAIHLDRKINNGYEFNIKNDMCPIAGEKSGRLTEIIANEIGVSKDEILGFDLSLYNRMSGSVLGTDNEYFSAPRIDDLQCVYASLEGFLNSNSENNVTVFASFDNEEVGSGTKQGAGSTFLRDTLERVCSDDEKYKMAVAKSFMLSCDNAHAVHPNHFDKADGENHVYINGGVVIKYNANQRYTTDAFSEAVVKHICKKADVPYQMYANRSDIPGGSTLGNISNEKVSLNTADIGLAQLAMHSAYETAGGRDTKYMVKMLEEFYKTEIY